MKKRFVLHPGLVKSRHDGDLHYISADRLCDLYHIPNSAVLAVINHSDNPVVARHFDDDVVHLYPLSNGNYYDAFEATPVRDARELMALNGLDTEEAKRDLVNKCGFSASDLGL